MGIVFACITPHGTEVVPEIAGDRLEAFAETRRGMHEIADLMRKQKPETIVLATPHNLRLEKTIGVITSEFSEGRLLAHGKEVKLRCRCDRQLARDIVENAKKKNLCVVGANYGTNDGEFSCMPMDWGTLIPLWFLIGQPKEETEVVIVTPSREIQLRQLIRFGHVIVKTVESSAKRVAFVASADQAHTHRADGIYGYHSSSAKFDKIAIKAVKQNNLKPLFSLPEQLIRDAKPDSVWQLAMLQGILESVPMKARLISYQVPTYFGMLCASYLPATSKTQNQSCHRTYHR